MKSLQSFLIKQHIKKVNINKLTLEDADYILTNNTYIIYVALSKVSSGGKELSDIYILKYGNNASISDEYGQAEYDLDSLDGQDLDGWWTNNASKYRLQNNVLKDFNEKTNKKFDDLLEEGNQYKEFSPCSMFETSKEAKSTFMRAKNIYELK